jgi:hypothetical protein
MTPRNILLSVALAASLLSGGHAVAQDLQSVALVHSAFADSSNRAKAIPMLQARDINVVFVQVGNVPQQARPGEVINLIMSTAKVSAK